MSAAAPATTVLELERRAGVHGREFVRYACEALWPAVYALAIADGLNPSEADALARATVHGAVRAHSSSLRAAIKLRHYRGEL